MASLAAAIGFGLRDRGAGARSATFAAQSAGAVVAAYDDDDVNPTADFDVFMRRFLQEFRQAVAEQSVDALSLHMSQTTRRPWQAAEVATGAVERPTAVLGDPTTATGRVVMARCSPRMPRVCAWATTSSSAWASRWWVWWSA